MTRPRRLASGVYELFALAALVAVPLGLPGGLARRHYAVREE